MGENSPLILRAFWQVLILDNTIAVVNHMATEGARSSADVVLT